MEVPMSAAIENNATEATETPPMRFTLRGVHNTEQEGTHYEFVDPLKGLKQILAETAFTQAEPVIRWTDRTRLAALDCDWHGDRADLERYMALVGVSAPDVYWTTHGGGA